MTVFTLPPGDYDPTVGLITNPPYSPTAGWPTTFSTTQGVFIENAHDVGKIVLDGVRVRSMATGELMGLYVGTPSPFSSFTGSSAGVSNVHVISIKGVSASNISIAWDEAAAQDIKQQ